MKSTPSIQAIADALGLSKATVSKALNGYPQIKEETRARVVAYARQIGYQLPTSSRGNAASGRRVGVVIESVPGNAAASATHHEIMMAFKQYADKLGMEVVLLGTSAQEQRHITYDQFIAEKQLHGVLVLGLQPSDPYYQQMYTTQVPTVLWNALFDNPMVACVSVDAIRGADLATSHLMSLGHRKIGLLNGDPQAEMSYNRLSGYLLALRRGDLQSNPAYILYGDGSEESGEDAADAFVQTDVTAIFCASDQMALGVMGRLAELGKAIPEDYAIVGYDNSLLAQVATPALTTINQNRALIGEMACALLNCIFQDIPIRNALLRPELVIRDSCGTKRFGFEASL